MDTTLLAGLAPIDFDEVRGQMRTAPGFPHFCIDNFLTPGLAASVSKAFPSYADAREMGVSFAGVNEKRKTQITDHTLFPAPIRELHDLLASDAFVERMSYISGIANLQADPQLVGGGIHETNHGGHLDVHVDFNVHDDTGLFRRLNILVYFNEEWPDAYGGVLDLWDADVRRCVARIAPLFNRAAGFATSGSSWHGVTPVTCPPDRMRRSFAAYYYSTEPPPGWDGVRRSTIFRARPQEHWKGKVAMPVERALHTAREAWTAAKRRLGGGRPG
jgi:2-oxoglutarate-Fe(II)-dependent oxygenase superfamily protein